MVEHQLRARGIEDERVLEAFMEVPREQFVPPSHRHNTYADRPLPIGGGQTISQPFVVGLMLQKLQLQPEDVVLDVGCGSGYQTALLSRLARHVYAIERIEELTEQARTRLADCDYTNITLKTGDGSLGWPEHAPYQGIICGAGSPDVPPAWIKQLDDGGNIVLPVGSEGAQQLVQITRHGDEILKKPFCDVRFVPLIGKQGWKR